MARTPSPPDDTWEELLPLLDQELNNLPEKYRVPVVLCDLEGRPRKEVAGRLKVPEGTLSSRLAAARKLLARRLARYGPLLSGTALAALLAERGSAAAVPAPLLVATERAAAQVAAGQALTAGAVPARVIALSEGVVKTMLLCKLRTIGAVAVTVFFGAAAVGLTYQTGAAEPARAARPAADELDELRLEIAALRKGLEATRERVKDLEAEVQTLKGRQQAAVPPKGTGRKVQYVKELPQTYYSSVKFLTTEVEDPLAQAEAALKRLQKNPQDKRATGVLEQALQRLKERAKAKEAPTNVKKP
jgi:5-bromo-4-chloroindolyl phosphate hydrolysis protein